MIRNSAINLSLKVGLTVPLAYTALAAVVVPEKVLSYWPEFISSNINESILVFASGLAALGMIGWIFSGKKKFAAAVTLTVLLALGGLVNITNIPFLVSLAPLFFIAAALSLRYYPRIRIISRTRVTPLVHLTPIDEDGEHLAEIEDEDDYNDYEDDDSDDDSDGKSTPGSATIVVESDIHTEHDQHIFVPKQ